MRDHLHRLPHLARAITLFGIAVASFAAANHLLFNGTVTTGAGVVSAILLAWIDHQRRRRDE